MNRITTSAAAILALLLTTLPGSLGFTQTAPFQFQDKALGIYGPVWVEAQIDLAEGIMDFSAMAPYAGGFVGRTAIGADYRVNDGINLNEFKARPSIRVDLRGDLFCDDGVGLAFLYLIQDRFLGGEWVQEQAARAGFWDCGGVETTSVWQTVDFTFPQAINYYAGSQYRISARLAIQAYPLGGADEAAYAFVDFGQATRRVIVEEIRVPPQAPVATLPVYNDWWVSALLFGHRVVGHVCDYDGDIHRATVRVVETGASSTLEPYTACASPEVSPLYLVPGEYHAILDGLDTETMSAHAEESFTLTLLPQIPVAGPAARLADLDEIPSVVRFGLDASGSIVSVAADGIPLAGIGPTQPAAHVAEIVIDRESMIATAVIDGVVRWAGEIEPTGPEWWQVAPRVG